MHFVRSWQQTSRISLGRIERESHIPGIQASSIHHDQRLVGCRKVAEEFDRPGSSNRSCDPHVTLPDRGEQFERRLNFARRGIKEKGIGSPGEGTVIEGQGKRTSGRSVGRNRLFFVRATAIGLGHPQGDTATKVGAIIGKSVLIQFTQSFDEFDIPRSPIDTRDTDIGWREDRTETANFILHRRHRSIIGNWARARAIEAQRESPTGRTCLDTDSLFLILAALPACDFTDTGRYSRSQGSAIGGQCWLIRLPQRPRELNRERPTHDTGHLDIAEAN